MNSRCTGTAAGRFRAPEPSDPGHRRRRHHRLEPRRPAGRPGRRTIVVLDNLVRGRTRQPGLGPGQRAGRPRRGRHPRPRPGARGHSRVRDLVFHQAAIRITQCAEEPRLAIEVLVDGTFNVLEAAAAAGVGKVVAVLLGIGLRAGRAVPDRRATTTPTTTTRSTARPRPSTRACCAASTPCTAWTTSRCATSTSTARAWTSTASTPRCSSAGWSASPPGQPPLIFGDGTQTMDFVYVRRHRPRQRAGRRVATLTDEVFNVASGVETSLRDLAQALLRAMDSDLPTSSTARPAPVNGVTRRLADTSAAPRDGSASGAEIDLDAGLRRPGRLVARQRRTTAPRRHGGPVSDASR